MISHFLSRFAYYLSVFLGIVVFSFALFHIVPSDPARAIIGPNAQQVQVERLREKLGLNEPLHLQLLQYLKNVLSFDFGHSYVDDRNVLHEVMARFGITLALTVCSMIILFIYLLLTISSFLFPPFIQKCLDAVDFLMSSLPIFFSGIIMAIFSLYYYPITTFSGNFASIGDILYLFPPALVLAFYPMAILAEIVKKEISSVLQSLYIINEESLGFEYRYILFGYALKNILIPLLSALSNILPVFITGAFVVEIIFSIPGIGTLLIKSIFERDFPMLECTIVFNGAFFVLVNLLFESLYPLIDPRFKNGNFL